MGLSNGWGATFALTLAIAACGNTGSDTSAGSGAGGSPACQDLSGDYDLNGTCNSPSVVPARFASMTQTDCNVVLTTDNALAMKGTVSGNRFQVSATSPTEQTCTGSLSGTNLAANCVIPSVGVNCTFNGARR
jgi:hypothetical protein